MMKLGLLMLLSLLSLVTKLEQKKESVRENALCSIIEILNSGKELQSLQNNFATCQYWTLDLIKRGSSKVKQLASHVLGLVAMTLCDSDSAQEIYTQSLPALTIALSKTSKMIDSWVFTSLLNSLAMVTFFCASNIEETEAGMQLIWECINLSRPKFDVPASKQVPYAIVSAAITAWSFLLSSVDTWELNHKIWQGTISNFLHMLEADDESVYVAAGEALALIFDIECLNKFFKDEDLIMNTSTMVENTTVIPVKYSERKILIKHKIINQLEKLSVKARNETSLRQSFNNNAARVDWDVLKYFKDDYFPQTSQRINGHKLTLSSWSQMIQLKFLKIFHGEDEFGKNMLENEFFHYLFDFTPIHKQDPVQELYESTFEKRNSTINKAKTKVMNKRRMFAEERKGKMYNTESEI